MEDDIDIGAVVLLTDASDPKREHLMLEQNRGGGSHYAPPAGTFDESLDESPRHTAVREVSEETKIQISLADLNELFETDAEMGVDKLVWYEVKTHIDKSLINTNHESQDYRFLTPEDALEEELLDDTRIALTKLL